MCERDHDTYLSPSAEHLEVVAAMLNKGADVFIDMGYGNSIDGALKRFAGDIIIADVDSILPNKIIMIKMLLLSAGTFTDDEINNIDVTDAFVTDDVMIDDDGVQRLKQHLRKWRDEVEQLKRSYLATLMSFNRLADPTKPTHQKAFGVKHPRLADPTKLTYQNVFGVKVLTNHILSFTDFFHGVSPQIVFANQA